MSYPPLAGYGQYYDSNQSSNQSARSAYGSNRQLASGSYGQQYQRDDRESQYGSTGYDWQGQNQPTYATDAHQQYTNDPWREANEQNRQHDYRRESRNYATQAAAANTAQSSYPSTSQPGQSLQGLNNLAYASGLDNQRQSSSHSQQTGESISKYSTTPGAIINRVQSPMQGHQQQKYSSAQPAAYGGHDGASSSIANPQLAISAAQALAGAVSRRYQQGGAGNQQRTASPTVSNAPAVDFIIQRSSSPRKTSSSTESYARGASAQSQRSYPPQHQPTHQITNSTESHSQVPASSQSRSQYDRRSSQNERRAASQSIVVSNLMSTIQAQEPTQTSTGMASDSMPTYIDPTQVFNPYHKEHERRRKEATEAESRRKEQGAKTQEEQRRKEAETAGAAKKAPKSEQKAKNAAPTTKGISPVEDEMALEMKMMMEKMKEFRSRDPSLFQKLWEETRKGSGVGPSASAKSVPTSTATASSTSPKISQQTAPAQAIESAAPTPGQSKPPMVRTTGSSAASQMSHGQASGYKVVVEDNGQALPDIGRFPAERRIRASHAHSKASPASQMPAAASGSIPTPGLNSTLHQNLLGKSPTGGVEWPLDKRDALASAAIESLKANPENEKIGIAPADIHNMLAQNPSYIQLCDMLEKKGLKFHRGQFARQLLVSVPDLATPQRKGGRSPSPASTQLPPGVQQQSQPPRPQQSHQVAYSLPPPPPLPPHFHTSAPAPAPYPTPSHSRPTGFLSGPPNPVPHPYQQAGRPFHAPRAVKPEHPQFPVPRPSKKKSTLPTRPDPPPGSKEAMARKRDFNELIDLTGLSDTDDYVLSNKHPRLESASPEPNPFAKYQQHSVTGHAAPGLKLNGRQEGAPLRFNTYQLHQAPAHRPPSPLQRPKTILARPLNKNEALRKSYYDPKTVAKDILIAAGRHPTERPLNAHWAGLLGVHIDLDSDLSTFDWDSIDPGGPPAPKVEHVDIPAGPPRFKLGERSGELRLPDSAKREVKEAAAPASLQFHRFKGSPRDASDQVRGHAELKPSKLRQSQVIDEQTPARALTPPKRRLSGSSSLHTRPSSLRPSSRQLRASMEVEAAAEAARPGAFYPSGRRRGRPPGAKNKHPTLTAMKKTARTPQPLVEIPAKSSPPGTSVFRCRWRACHAELHNLETLRRHITRVHQPSEEEITDHGYVCWWKKCKFLVQEGDEISASQNFESLEDWQHHIEEDHLHKIAMKLGDGPSTLPIGKQASPSASPFDVSRFLYQPPSSPTPGSSTAASAITPSHTDPQTLFHRKSLYLSDNTGKLVTPSLTPSRNSDLPRDTLILTKSHAPGNRESDVAAYKGFLRAHSKGGEKIGVKMNAEEMLRAMERRKMVVGAGVERGGCTLVNEARREGWIGNRGVRRVVEADY